MHAPPTPATIHPTLAAARALAPLVREHAAAAERDRGMSEVLHLALAEAGVYRMLVPHAAGGDGTDLPAALRVVEALAMVDGSTGWCAAIGSGTNLFGAFMEADGAAETIWRDPNRIAAAVFAPSGRAAPADGGYRMTGRWTFASGCRHADWFFGNCLIMDGDAPAVGEDGSRRVMMLGVPMEQARIHDTWHVSGLRGTGSHDVEVVDAWVPARRAFVLGGDTSRLPGPFGVFPFGAFLGAYLAVVATGIARGALDTLAGGMAERLARDGGDVSSVPGSLAGELARLEGSARSARRLLYHHTDSLWARLVTGEAATPADGVDIQLAATHAAHASAEVVSSAFRLAGAAALFDHHPLQRALRDVHAVTQHAQLSFRSFERLGRNLVTAAGPGG